jgi:hypothetical protein
MPWTYEQTTGNMSRDGTLVGTGYSGHGTSVNDPDAQDQPNVGPIPQGNYTIGAAKTPVDHLGPRALPLTPAPRNSMFGRSAFFIHGDNAAGNHSASDGCIILGPTIRQQIVDSGDTVLVVIAGAPAAVAGGAAAET